MSDGALFEELKDEFHPPLSPTLIATLLLDLDPSDSSSLPTIRSSLQLLAAETQEPEPYFYPSSDEDDDDDDQADADDVQRMLASWSLDGSSAASGVDGGLSEHGGSSTGTSVSASSSRDDSIEFLKMLFPYSSTSTLEQALNDCPGSEMTVVVEHLLSIEAIREADEADGWADDYSLSDSSPDAWARLTQDERDRIWESGGLAESSLAVDQPAHVEAAPKQKKAKTKKAGLQKTTVGGLPTGVLVRPSASPATSTRSLGPAATIRGASSKAKPGESNAWVAMSSVASSLADILGPASPKASATHFNSFLHSSAAASSYANVLASLTALNQPPPPIETDYLAMLVFSETTPDKRQREVLAVVWTAAAGEVDIALDLWTLLENVKERSGDPGPLNGGLFVPPPPTVAKSVKPSSSSLRTPPASAPTSPILQQKPLPRPTFSTHLHPISRNPPTQPSPTTIPLPPSPVVPNAKLKHGFKVPGGRAQRTKFAPSGKQMAFHPLAESIPAYKGGGVAMARELSLGMTTSKKGGWLALKEREARERRLRDEALRTASRHFTSGNGTNQGRAIAAHYAEQARKHNEASRALGLEAAKDQIYSSARTTPSGIDLHGLNLYQATHIVDESVDAWWEDSRRRSSPFTIITGRGLHSDQARAVLRPAISRQLKQAGWRVSEGTEGVLRVIGR